MAQWGKTDTTGDSVLWGVSQLEKEANTVNRDALYNNTTPDTYFTGVTVSQNAVDPVEAEASLGKIPHAGWVLTTEGTGGRVGRVQHEVLVAMGSITGDGTDDTLIPDYGIVFTTQPSNSLGIVANAVATTNDFLGIPVFDSVPTGGTVTWKWQASNDGSTSWADISSVADATHSGITYSDVANGGTNSGLDIQVTNTTNAIDTNGGMYYRLELVISGQGSPVYSDVVQFTFAP